MTQKARTLVSWSSGKDGAWALHLLLRDAKVEVNGLFTVVSGVHRRVAMHAVPEELLAAQAREIGLPLCKVELPSPCSDEQYEAVMEGFLEEARRLGTERIAFADLFLEDIRRYREDNMRGTGIRPVFPLWGTPTDRLARSVVRKGFRAIVTCVDPRRLPPDFAGRAYDEAFLGDLPAEVDPCGENGEFHTFVYDGPIFRRPLRVRAGRVVEREGFVFADLVEAAADLTAESAEGAEKKGNNRKETPTAG